MHLLYKQAYGKEVNFAISSLPMGWIYLGTY